MAAFAMKSSLKAVLATNTISHVLALLAMYRFHGVNWYGRPPQLIEITQTAADWFLGLYASYRFSPKSWVIKVYITHVIFVAATQLLLIAQACYNALPPACTAALPAEIKMLGPRRPEDFVAKGNWLVFIAELYSCVHTVGMALVITVAISLFFAVVVPASFSGTAKGILVGTGGTKVAKDETAKSLETIDDVTLFGALEVKTDWLGRRRVVVDKSGPYLHWQPYKGDNGKNTGVVKEVSRKETERLLSVA